MSVIIAPNVAEQKKNEPKEQPKKTKKAAEEK